MAKRKPASKARAKKKSATAKKPVAAPLKNARPMWSGTLRLSLVSVPVQIYPATLSTARIAFHQVHRPTGKRIRYEKTVPGIGPVDTDDIVKGFELQSGNYVLLEPEEIDNVKLEAKRIIDLVQFVSQGEIDPIWFDRPYYIVPDEETGEEAYRTLRDALRASKRLGLGQFVMRGREYIVAVKPCGNGLLLETLRFADELRTAAPYFAGFDDDPPEQELLDLATELIERKTAPFQPRNFHDHYTEALRELIDAKARHETPVQVDEAEPRHGAKVIDLVEALKRSVRRERGTDRGTKPRRKAG